VITSIRTRARYDAPAGLIRPVGPACQNRPMTEPADPGRPAADRMLLDFLDAQRAAVLAVVDGLDETGLGTAVVPSGWTPLGLIEHLGYAERHWFQGVLLGAEDPLPWADGTDDDPNPLGTRHPVQAVFGFYRQQIARATEIVAGLPLSTPPRGVHDEPPPYPDDVVDLRFIVLHMIEETARHAGHLDLARELIDGRTGLGPR
jgi:hypothetical protein